MDDAMRRMMLRAVWVVGLAAAAGGVAACGQGDAVREAFRRGATAMHAGKSAEAEAGFREAVRLAPEMAEAHLDLGLVLGREGKQEEAVGSLERAIALDPTLASAHMFLGIFLYQAGRQEEALTALRAELAMDPKNGEALLWLGIVELAAGHAELAVPAFDEAVALAPDDLNLLEYRGRAHSMVARDSYARMARLDPDAWQVHKVRAELLAEEGKGAEAVKEYEAAIAKEPRNSDLYEGLGDQYRKANELEAAEKAYAREMELTPRNPIAMYNLGSTEIERGNDAAGVPLLEAMVGAYRGSAVAEYYLGRGLAAEGGKEKEAAGWLEKSAALDPAGEVGKRSWYELARLYRKMQRPDDAAKALAAYTRLREAEAARNAKQVQDWRRLDAGGGAGC